MLRPGGVTHSHTRTHSPGSIFWLAALSGILVDLCGNKQMQPAQKNDGGKGQQLNVQRVTDMQRLAPTHAHHSHTEEPEMQLVLDFSRITGTVSKAVAVCVIDFRWILRKLHITHCGTCWPGQLFSHSHPGSFPLRPCQCFPFFWGGFGWVRFV